MLLLLFAGASAGAAVPTVRACLALTIADRYTATLSESERYTVALSESLRATIALTEDEC